MATAASFPCGVKGCDRTFARASEAGRHRLHAHGIPGVSSKAKVNVAKRVVAKLAKNAHNGNGKRNHKANGRASASLIEAVQTLKVERDAMNMIIARLEAML